MPESLEAVLIEASMPLQMQVTEPSADVPLIRSGAPFTHLVFVQHGTLAHGSSPTPRSRRRSLSAFTSS